MNLLQRYASKPRRRVLGLMSGTSADGVDAALVEVAGASENTEAHLLAFKTYPYPEPVRRALFDLFAPDSPAVELCRMNFLLGRLFAEAALALLAEQKLSPADIDLIASHGQTICHFPPRTPGETGATLQIAEGAVIAEKLGLPVVCDFRPADLAAGGEGAPLVPFADYVLFHSPDKTRAVQNIGGIANVTVLPAGARLSDTLAFDTGPGNMILDALAWRLTEGRQAYDHNGELAARGQVNTDLLRWLLSHPYLSRRPPKSTGREEFGQSFVEELLRKAELFQCSLQDALTTATAFTAESIARSYRHFILPHHPIDEIILGGGGSHNSTLRRFLQQQFPALPLLSHEDFGLPSKAKEALAFALLGNETMLGRPANLPSATGASHLAILGKILLPPPPLPQIRKCSPGESGTICAIINEAAQVYKGVIPPDRWKEPYMSRDELTCEMEEGVVFWGYEDQGDLVGVMGLQQVRDVALIRHAYVRPARQNQGLGGKLLARLREETARPLLVGTWASAAWAIRFYEKHGFRLVSSEEKDRLLRNYWSIPERQIETSVVLADQSWLATRDQF